jgi:hypothetical protein
MSAFWSPSTTTTSSQGARFASDHAIASVPPL